MNRIILALLFVLMSAPLLAAQADKVDICHFDSEGGYWELINISENALPAHLANHDDNFPEQTTGITGTYLDENCEADATLPDCGNCLTAHGGLGCEEAACAALVCYGDVNDPYCCDSEWDDICALEAADSCQGNICN